MHNCLSWLRERDKLGSTRLLESDRECEHPFRNNDWVSVVMGKLSSGKWCRKGLVRQLAMRLGDDQVIEERRSVAFFKQDFGIFAGRKGCKQMMEGWSNLDLT